MARILVNGLKAKTGGGRSILSNYLSLLRGAKDGNLYFVLTPNRDEYLRFESEKIRIVDVPTFCKSNALFPVLYFLALPILLRRLRIDLIFNLGDIVIPSRTPQVYLFDWPYAIYPESVAWKRMGLKDTAVRRFKELIVRNWIDHAAITIAQTGVAKERLERIYGLNAVEVVPNAVSLENLETGDSKDFDLPQGRNLLCLTFYYPHKNLEVLLEVAEKIRDRGLGFRIVVTLDAGQGQGAAAFLGQVRDRGLQNVIRNVGSVEMRYVPSLYRQCDALLMPTLLESFSGTYVEAMFHGIPVFTSHLDFAEAVCGDCAWYFDPLDPDAILESLVRAYAGEEERKEKIERGRSVVRSMPGWHQTFKRYQEVLEHAAGNAWGRTPGQEALEYHASESR